MKNKYLILKQEHEKKINAFPQFFAFSEEQFKEGMQKLKVNSKEELLSTGYSGFIRRSEKDDYIKLWQEINQQLEDSLKNDDFLFDAFRYELSNHEFIITYDYEDTLQCLGLKYETLTEKQKEILEKAKNDYLKDMEEYE